jgi:FAD/FMN-containing dehydrogenase
VRVFLRSVYRRGTAGYENARRATAWCRRLPERYPEVIVNCRSEDDVLGAVRMAREQNLKLSVCSGGHSWHANHLRDGALLVNMHGMTDYSVDLPSMSGSAQPGLRGSDLYLALKEHSVWFPTGHCTDVSIGGFLLQGGVAFNNHRTGPACGHVTAIDVVTATGELIHATDSNEHADLLWAARGAGGGFFAIVTRYYIRLHPAQILTSSFYSYPAKYLEDVLGFLQEVGPTTPTEINAMIAWDRTVDPDAPIITVGVLAFAESHEEGVRQLAVYESCPVRDKAIAAQIGEVTTQDAISLNGADRHYVESKFYNGDCIWTNASIDATGPILRRITDSLEGMSHVLFTNFGTDTPPPRPPMAFSLDAKYYYGVYAVWDDPADERRMREWHLKHMKALEPHSTGMALADENLEDRPARFMLDDNLRRLDRIRDRYDPEHRFVQWMGRPWPPRAADATSR